MDVTYKLNPAVTNAQLDDLYLASWPNHDAPFRMAVSFRWRFAGRS
jgi:hypothetical protein